jgi:hypothetical protein
VRVCLDAAERGALVRVATCGCIRRFFLCGGEGETLSAASGPYFNLQHADAQKCWLLRERIECVCVLVGGEIWVATRRHPFLWLKCFFTTHTHRPFGDRLVCRNTNFNLSWLFTLFSSYLCGFFILIYSAHFLLNRAYIKILDILTKRQSLFLPVDSAYWFGSFTSIWMLINHMKIKWERWKFLFEVQEIASDLNFVHVPGQSWILWSNIFKPSIPLYDILWGI